MILFYFFQTRINIFNKPNINEEEQRKSQIKKAKFNAKLSKFEKLNSEMKEDVVRRISDVKIKVSKQLILINHLKQNEGIYALAAAGLYCSKNPNCFCMILVF